MMYLFLIIGDIVALGLKGVSTALGCDTQSL